MRTCGEEWGTPAHTADGGLADPGKRLNANDLRARTVLIKLKR